jgi:hypothetical protein
MTVGRIPVIEGGIQPTIFDAKADLLTATANDTPARLAVGSDYGFLQADSTAGTGLAWNAGAWTSYTPTITAGTGSITTYTSGGFYIRVGKLCVVRAYAAISNTGTGASNIVFTLPFSSKSGSFAAGHGSGREQATTGKMLEVFVPENSPTGIIWFYDNSYPGATGNFLAFNAIYEVA